MPFILVAIWDLWNVHFLVCWTSQCLLWHLRLAQCFVDRFNQKRWGRGWGCWRRKNNVISKDLWCNWSYRLTFIETLQLILVIVLGVGDCASCGNFWHQNVIHLFVLHQVRRGADRAEIYSLAFSPTAQWLAVSSDKGTVHIFSLKVDSGAAGTERSYNASKPIGSSSSMISSLSFMKGRYIHEWTVVFGSIKFMQVHMLSILTYSWNFCLWCNGGEMMMLKINLCGAHSIYLQVFCQDILPQNGQWLSSDCLKVCSILLLLGIRRILL